VNTVIKAQGLSKKYIIGHQRQERYLTLRDTMSQKFKGIGKRLLHPFLSSSGQPLTGLAITEDLWALKDASFEISQGDRIGIIGRNGAGKTTLLKILSRITEPTEGRVSIKGRVASLLEVGTGFHPELTGRENIYLNGAVLGMTRAEIKKKFDEIVAFAEVDKFLDTPLKRYSNGMYVRLAFSVAAHLQPEILLVDEVLAVGDIAFQKKCIGRMGEVAKRGRTVIFVSHNMGAIRSLCGSAIWLDNGRIVKNGTVNEVVGDYMETQIKGIDESSYVVQRNYKDVENFHFSHVEMLNTKGEHTTIFRYGENLVLIVDFAGELTEGVFSAEFYIHNELGQLVSVGASGPYHGKYFSKKVRKIRIEIGPLTITSGKYRISLSLMAGAERIDTWESAITFTIIECQPFATSWEIPARREGVCVLKQSFYEIR
jgi:lipopolysaccharide transport system ATP-binding protein